MSEFTWVEISKANFQHNLAGFRALLRSRAKLLTVVKSNAYGHGLVEMARLAVEYGSDWLGAVNLNEALKLRAAGIKAPVLVLSFWQKDEAAVREALAAEVSLAVYDFEQLEFLDRAAGEMSGGAVETRARVHLKFDTGTTRLGILPEQAENFLSRVFEKKYLEIEGVFSHLAASEENEDFTIKQRKIFEEIAERVAQMAAKQGRARPLAHLACSAAGMEGDNFHFDLARLGVSAYGLWPSELAKEKAREKYPSFDLKPVLTWKTKIIQIKNVPKGTSVGYGCTYLTDKPTQIAVLPVGYWDGVDRKLSNKGEFLVKGQRCPIRGRICMNLTMIDVTGLNVRVGESVTLIGKDGENEITADDWAKWAGTINYEIVARINPLIPRKYIKNVGEESKI